MAKPQTTNKNRTVLTVSLMIIIATILIIIFLIIALLLAPKSMPEFAIADKNGEWQAQGTIAVFDDKIMPGSEGEYKFIIKNDSDVNLLYGFRLSEYVGGVNENSNPFMQYRLKVDNIPIDDQWNYVGFDYDNIEILPTSSHLLTLEWRWPFESGDDGNDTLVGSGNGQLSVWLDLIAEVVYD